MIAWVLGAALHVLVPHVPAAGADRAAATGDRAAQPVVIVDLNHADLTELTRLPGVGPKRAEAILARRKQQPFTRVTQLLEVKGIGKKTLERLKPHLRIVPVMPVAPVVRVAPAEPGKVTRPGT